MINTIVLDIGNVLAHFRWKEYLDDCGYHDEIKHKISKATVLSERWAELDRGVLDEGRLMEQCCQAEPEVEKEIRKFFSDISELVWEYDYSADFVRKLKANGYHVYLLSNYASFTFQYAKENFEFIKYVDGGIISYEVKCIKPEAQIYQLLIDTYQIRPEEAVFLDDVFANLMGAKPFGFHTIQVHSHAQALQELRELGVNV